MESKTRVLFLSTGNSTRSIMGAGFLRASGDDHYHVWSAGVVAGESDPLASEVMKEVGIDIRGQETIETARALKIHFGYVITLYDAATERSPIFPFTFNLLQWNIPDPALVDGSHERRIEAFRGARNEIHSRVQAFMGEAAEKEQEHGILVHA